FDRPEGHLFACCPQVKTPAGSERLWAGLGDEVSVVSTDTCSFTRAQKHMWWQGDERGYGDWTKIPMGLPGLDTMVPLLYTHGVRAGRISINELVRLCATNPARIMGIRNKGELAPGFDADIAIINPRASRVVSPSTLQSRCDWSPYEGRELFGFAHTTLVRGVPVVENGAVVGTPGHGRFVERQLPV
ncbi:MAG: amidohydrolase family protein, partial [Phycisphaerales bacterium]